MNLPLSLAYKCLKGRVRRLAAGLWPGDGGAALSVEYVLVVGVLATGLAPGLAAARHSINAAYTHGGSARPAAVPAP